MGSVDSDNTRLQAGAVEGPVHLLPATLQEHDDGDGHPDDDDLDVVKHYLQGALPSLLKQIRRRCQCCGSGNQINSRGILIKDRSQT